MLGFIGAMAIGRGKIVVIYKRSKNVLDKINQPVILLTSTETKCKNLRREIW